MRLEQLQDRQHDVVDVAEPGGLGLFRVVHPSRPVEAHLGPFVVEQRGAADRAARVELFFYYDDDDDFEKDRGIESERGD